MEKIFRQRINRDDGMISRNENNVVRTSSMSEKMQTQRVRNVSEQSGKYSASEKMNRKYNGKKSEVGGMPKKAA